ncbi:MAG TPA: LPS-assembly protein LptD, partial [Hellea balneolensis]|nr:LPS-assembly protein LptD [Hellea balneolensis]
MAKSISRKALYTTLMASLCLSVFSAPALGQIGGFTKQDEDLKLAKNSPFRDPDVIYLEADNLENDQVKGILTASGQVEGRYQDKTLRADKVVYSLNSGRVVAIGNVTLINADGSTQYADKLELSDELEAGTAANFTSRFSEGGQMAAAFASRTTEGGVELYNAYYTACTACQSGGTSKKPSWRIKARKVTQNKKTKSIRYRDAVFEFKGIPFFYTPYLAHPDPSVGRASGFLVPNVGISGNKGATVITPYYFALSPYSELTLTPHVFSGANPLLEAQYRRKFYSGEFNIEGSTTYSSFFGNDGKDFAAEDFFANPEESLRSKKWRSHIFTNGLFNLNDQWKWGFEAGYATDDNYLDRYDLDERRPRFGLYTADTRRLSEQLFVVGQGDTFRFSTSAFGTVSLRTSVRRDPNNPNRIIVSREDDSTLPVIAPKIELTKYFKDPLVGGRLKLFSDTTVLTREIGTDYIRATSGLDWQKNIVTPLGIEVKPFTQARFDYFNLEAEGESSFDFSRSTGQVGVDVRWPFMKAGENVNWIIEPRVQLTQNFGDGKLDRFSIVNSAGQDVILAQDSLDIDL